MTNMEAIKRYAALKGEAKIRVTPPCKLCGWGPDETIHNNPALIKPGAPYHDFVPKGE
jgi:hypothetical protein